MASPPRSSTDVQFLGPSPEDTGVATVLLHGRNQAPSDMFAVAERIGLKEMPYVALQAANNSWYPERFMAPIEQNQPWLDLAIGSVDRLIAALERMEIRSEKIAILGFSQGACLACEYVFRHPKRYGGLIALTGGLIGPEGTAWSTAKSLTGTPIFLGNGDHDEWVPLSRTVETASILKDMAGDVQLKVFPDRPHQVNDEEIEIARSMLHRLLAPTKSTA